MKFITQRTLSFFLLLLLWSSHTYAQTTFYTYQNGDWDDPTIWTLDPSGTICTNPNNEFPNGDDEAVILNGRTVTVDFDNLHSQESPTGVTPINPLAILDVQGGGVVDFQGTINHDIDVLRGEGKIRFSGNGGMLNYPTIATPDEFLDGDGEVELYGTTPITIDQDYTFPNLVIAMNAGVDAILQIPMVPAATPPPPTEPGTLTINKDLRVLNGRLLFGNTTDFIVDVFEDVRVETTGEINIQLGADVRHQFNLYGDFLNLGTVQFSERTARNTSDILLLTNESTDTKVDFNLVNVAANQIVICNGPSLFYRIEVAKQNRVYIADFTASAPSNFVLTGPANTPYNSQDGMNDAITALPIENDNALAVISGTTKIGTGIDVGLLNNTDFYSIPENARLWVDGGDIEHQGTATIVYGTLEVSGGTFDENGSQGIILRGSGLIQVDGGSVTSSNIRTSFVGAGTGEATGYLQSGGITRLTGNITYNPNYSVFSLPYQSNVFQMSGGTLEVSNARSTTTSADASNDLGGLIYINSSTGNINVTGGTVRVISSNTNTGNVITSTAPFFNLRIDNTINDTNPDARIRIDEGSNGVGPLESGTTDLAAQDLIVLNDLIIQNDGVTTQTRTTGADTYGSYLDLCPNGTDCANLEVGRNLIIEESAVLDVFNDNVMDANSATVTFNGTGNSTFNIGDVTSYTAGLTGYDGPEAGTAYTLWDFPLYNLVVDKSGATFTLATPGTYDAGNDTDVEDGAGNKNINGEANNLLRIANEFTLEAGSVNHDVYSMRFFGEVTNKGILGTATTPTDALLKFEDVAGTETVNTTEGAEFGNVLLDIGGGNALAFTNDAIIRRLDYQNGSLNIDTHNLTVDEFANNLTATFDANNMILTAGNASDGGLSLLVPATGDYRFPVGTTGEYTPATFDMANTGGYVTANAVNKVLATTNQSGGADILSRYWRVRSSGFSPTINSAEFVYVTGDVGGTETNYVAGQVLDGGDYTRSGENFLDANNNTTLDVGEGTGDLTSVDDATNTITFNGGQAAITPFSLENTNFTAGQVERFLGNVRIFYSTTTDYGNDTNGAGDPWDDGDSWSFVGHYSNVYAGTFPQNGDVAILGFGLDNPTSTIDDGPNRSHWFRLDTDITLAELVFAESQENDNGDEVVRDVSDRPQLIIEDNAALNIDLGTVRGVGSINLEVNCAPCNADPSLSTIVAADLVGDFGEFSSNVTNDANTTSRFDYDLNFANNVAVYVPSSFPTEYPELQIKGRNGNNRTLIFQEDILTNGSLRIRDNAVLRLSDQVNGDIHVSKDLIFTTSDFADILEFPSTGPGRTMRVDGNILMDNNGDRIRVLDNNDMADVLTHTLQVGGNIEQDIGQIDLYNGTGANRDHAILELIGTDNATHTRVNNPPMDLYRLIINKGTDPSTTFTFEADFNLPTPADIGLQPLEIVNGTLILDNPDIAIELTDGARESFYLPNTFTNPEASSGSGGLEVRQGNVWLSGNNVGLFLDGTLTVSGTGIVNIGDNYGDIGTLPFPITTAVTLSAIPADNNNNFIEYSSSGNSSITVTDNAELNVGGQIRRSPFATSGILDYTQTDGIVRVGIENNPMDWVGVRGVFEVTNAGSRFEHTGGILEAISGRNPLIVPDILIDVPAGNANTAGGEIITAGLSDVSISATNPLGDLRVVANKLQMNITTIDIDGRLRIDAGATFDSQSLDVAVAGNFSNDGTYNPDADDNNTTTFDGASHSIAGTGTSNFWNMTVNSSIQLQVSDNINVINLLRFGDAGQLNLTNAATLLRVQGDIVNNGSQVGPGTVVLNGTGNQTITSDDGSGGAAGAGGYEGTFSNLEIDKLSGRISQTDFKSNISTIRITNNFNLESNPSVYNLGDNLMVLEPNATITSTLGFSPTSMIKINGVESSFGLRKEIDNTFATGTSFTLPVGSRSVNSPSGGDKYTPVTFEIAANPLGAGDIRQITVRPIDDIYPSNKCSGAVTDILLHYWTVSTSGVTGLTDGVDNLNPSISFAYSEDDVTGTEANYANARLRTSESVWDEVNPPLPANGIDVGANTAEWTNARLIANGGTDEIEGDYTLGDPADIQNLKFYRTIVTTGIWDDGLTWESADDETFTTGLISPESARPCPGAVAYVQTGHDISMDVLNGVELAHAIIEGTLDLEETVKHAFTQIEGNGRIIARNGGGVLPGGEMALPPVWGTPLGIASPAPFTGSDGRGTIEFSSPNDGANFANYSFTADTRMSNLYNLAFAGNGIRGFGLQDIIINNDLIIGDGQTVTVEQNSTTIRLAGDLIKADNNDVLTVDPNPYPESSVIFDGTTNQRLQGEFVGALGSFYNLEVNNPAGITINGGNVGTVEVGSDGKLIMARGIITVAGHELDPIDKTLNENPPTTLRISSLVSLNAKNDLTDINNFGFLGAVADFNATRHINGVFCRELNAGAGEYLMPLGNNNLPFIGNTYGPMAIVNPRPVAGGARDWCAKYFVEEPINPFNIGGIYTFPGPFCSGASSVVKTSTIEHWWVEDDVTGGNAEMKLYWGPHSNVVNIGTPPNLRVMVYEDPASTALDWCEINPTTQLGGTATNGFIAAGPLGFSDRNLTLGTTDFRSTPLPVELISFTGTALENAIQLDWLTATETNSSHYVVEKSLDGVTFEAIDQVLAQGNSTSLTTYVSLDSQPNEGVNYYRLKQVDLDGTVTYSEIIVVRFQRSSTLSANNEKLVVVYPNPLESLDLGIRLEGFQEAAEISIQLYDMTGRKILSTVAYPEGSRVTDEFLRIPSQLSSGVYIVKISDGKAVFNKRIILK